MRWRFVDSGPDLEALDQMQRSIDRWWTSFALHIDALNRMFGGGEPFDLVSWMQTELGRVHPELMWEYGPAVNTSGHRLVITPEVRYELTELARAVVDRAPAISGWEFYLHRLAEPHRAAEIVASRTGGSLDDVTVSVEPGDDGLIDLRFATGSRSADHDSFLATEAMLGERALNDWVGEISVVKPSRTRFSLGRLQGVPVSDLPTAFEEAQQAVRDRIPGVPYHDWVSDGEWSLLKLEPAGGDDYPGTADTALAITASPDLWRASHGARFASERFSVNGETFVYVKIDGAEGLDGSEFEARDDIEDALNAVLTPEGLGAVVGAGTGLRYSYVDLALTDLEAGLVQVRERLAAGRVPLRSWIGFFDRIWLDEWIGIHPDTPPPPR